MKRLFTLVILFNAALFSGILYAQDLAPAFPGAEGHGRFTTGGRGGQVIKVTNLNDSGAGSLRAAIETSGPRLVIFEVSGIIALESELKIRNNDITIAGQTAPGDGICLKNYSLVISADNVIIRYIRARMGDERAHEGDAISGKGLKNIIIDHCSMSWSTDETGSFYDNENFTMQWCILSESLRVSVHDKGAHGYGGIWGGQKASFHHNILMHHDSRNPRMNGSRYTGIPEEELVDFRNNVIYNWGGNSGYGGEGGSFNFVNNYYRPGPASKHADRIFQPWPDNGSNTNILGTHGYFFVEGNIVHANTLVSGDNWLGIQPTGGLTDSDVFSDAEFDMGQITTHNADDAFDRVLTYAGTSLTRDDIDLRLTDEIKNGTITYLGSITGEDKPGIIDSQTDVGGWPNYTSLAAPDDLDDDGMPDDWEDVHGLNKNDGSDGPAYNISSVYTNVEVYMNSLVQNITTGQLAGGTSNYDSSTKAITIITWNNPEAIIEGTALDQTQLNATTNGNTSIPVYDPPAGTMLAVGTHTLTVTFPSDNNFTEATASVSIEVLEEPVLGLDEISINNFVYPNPASDYLYINNESRIIKLILMAIDGRVLLDSPLQTNDSKIDLRSYQKGTYLIQLLDVEGNKFTHKLLIQ